MTKDLPPNGAGIIRPNSGGLSAHLRSLVKNDWLVVLILVLILPSFYWIANDHHVWPWDQAWYGQVSVELFIKSARHFSRWALAMGEAFGSKAPGIAWLGQLFVPFGRAIGSVELGLLCSIIGTQIASIFLFYKVATEVAPGRRLIAATGILLFASAPLFVAMSHQYFPEPLQLFGATYFYFLAATGHRMQRVTLFGNLMLATAIALLAKITSPIYCALPGLIATYTLFQRDPNREFSFKGARWRWLWVLAGAVLCFACAKWYIRNFPTICQTLKMQTSPDFTLNYGRAGTFFNKFHYWVDALQWSFQLPWVIKGQLILVSIGWALAKFVRGRDGAKSKEPAAWRFNLLAIASVIHVLGVLSICSMNYNEENRYLLPLLPALATIDLWLVCKIRSPWLLAGVVGLLSYQWAAVCARALGWAPYNPAISSWVLPFDKSRTQAEEVTRLVERTSDVATKGRVNIVGVEFPWLNANTLSYFAAKQQLKTRSRSSYTSLGYDAKDLDLAWKRMMDLKINYYISLEEAAQPETPNFINLISVVALRRVRGDSAFSQESFPSKLGIVLFHRNAGNSAPPEPGTPAH